MSRLVDETGFSRQWLSKKAAVGQIPGASRTASGRWRFANSPSFQKWLITKRKVKKALMRNAIHKDRQLVERLKMKREKAWEGFGGTTQAFKKHMHKLSREITCAQDNVTDYLKTGDLAELTGRTKRWVTSHAHLIPGVSVSKNRFLFLKSDELAEWVWREKMARKAEIRKGPKIRGFGVAPTWGLFYDLRQLRFAADHLFRKYPLRIWPEDLREKFKGEVIELTKVFQSHIKST